MVVSLHPLSLKKRNVDKTGSQGSARTLKKLKQEIACVGGPPEGGLRTRKSQRLQRTILTMKSLILAQDER